MKFESAIGVHKHCIHVMIGIEAELLTAAIPQACITRPAAVKISEDSSLVLRGRVTIESLDLDGALDVSVADGASLHIHRLVVRNDGWTLVRIDISTSFATGRSRICAGGLGPRCPHGVAIFPKRDSLAEARRGTLSSFERARYARIVRQVISVCMWTVEMSCRRRWTRTTRV